jgi:hypothetical protein
MCAQGCWRVRRRRFEEAHLLQLPVGRSVQTSGAPDVTCYTLLRYRSALCLFFLLIAGKGSIPLLTIWFGQPSGLTPHYSTLRPQHLLPPPHAIMFCVIL